MRLGLTLKLGVLGLAVATLVLLAAGTKPVRAGPGSLPFPSGTLSPPTPTLGRLLSCPNYNGSDDNKVRADDVVAAVNKYRKDYLNDDGTFNANYWFMYDAVGSGGKIRVDDVTYVVNQYLHICPAVDTQIAKATQAIANPNYMDKLCDDQDATPYQTAVNCGGDPQFLTESPSFLQSRGYASTGIDVPGQGVHYGNFLGDEVFNPVRPEALVYKNGHLVAQLYYAEGDVVGWGPARDSNKHGVNTDALPCVPSDLEPPNIGCGWDSSYDGWHWHEDLCTVGIGTPSPHTWRLASQDDCATWGATTYGISCTFPPAANYNCIWRATIGWMSHLWNWYPNVNFTNASSGVCQPALCATGESNGRFADCFPDVQGWNAFNCPS